MISSELAKAVLGGEYKKLTYSDGNVIACHINIHELVNKCIEWAILQEMELSQSTWLHKESAYTQDEDKYRYKDNTVLFDMRIEGVEKGFENKGTVCLYEFNHKQEFKYYYQAVFTACEWILEQQNDT